MYKLNNYFYTFQNINYDNVFLDNFVDITYILTINNN